MLVPPAYPGDPVKAPVQVRKRGTYPRAWTPNSVRAGKGGGVGAGFLRGRKTVGAQVVV
ncbi:hypothetical protein YIM730264_25580 [Thermus hydrothermalis]